MDAKEYLRGKSDGTQSGHTDTERNAHMVMALDRKKVTQQNLIDALRR